MADRLFVIDQSVKRTTSRLRAKRPTITSLAGEGSDRAYRRSPRHRRNLTRASGSSELLLRVLVFFRGGRSRNRWSRDRLRHEPSVTANCINVCPEKPARLTGRCGGSHQTLGAGNTDKMRPVHDPLSSSIAQGMIGHHLAGMPDNDATRRQYHDLNTLDDRRQGTE